MSKYFSFDNSKYESLIYTKKNNVAYITLNRPERMNAINEQMPLELEQAVTAANFDDEVKIIVLQGSGKGFCSGYDLKIFAENKLENNAVNRNQKMPWDPYLDYKFMKAVTEKFMCLFNSLKPTICKIHGYAVAGGSDIALCCDFIIMSEDAKIGYPPARLWGCPTTAMWTFRVGPMMAKQLLLTGELIDGRQAQKIGLVNEACKESELEQKVQDLIDKMMGVPTNQLWMQKQVINSVIENMGLNQTQRLATIFDGISRHTPEGVEFQKKVEKVGFKQAVLERDAVFLKQNAKL